MIWPFRKKPNPSDATHAAERTRSRAKARYASRLAAGDTRGQAQEWPALRDATNLALKLEAGR